MSDNKDNKEQPSTLRSYVDSTTEAIQGMVDNITGKGGEQKPPSQQAQETAAKVPGGTVSSSGAFAKDDSKRAEGSWDQTIGSAKEAVGGLVGNESLKQAGRQQNLEGQQKEAKGQLGDYGSGLGQRAQGAVGGAMAGVTGDKEGQEHYERMREEGRARQAGAEHDMHKAAGGE